MKLFQLISRWFSKIFSFSEESELLKPILIYSGPKLKVVRHNDATLFSIMQSNFDILTILTWFSLRRVASKSNFVAVSSSARLSTSQARSHGCAFLVDSSTLFEQRTVDDVVLVVSPTADSSSTVRKHFVLAIYLIFLILHSLVQQPTWPARDIVRCPRFPCERQCVTLDKLP